MWREFDRWLLREEYGGCISEMERAGDFIDWTQERIKKSFAFGLGTEKDLSEYIRNNRKFCIFKEVTI